MRSRVLWGLPSPTRPHGSIAEKTSIRTPPLSGCGLSLSPGHLHLGLGCLRFKAVATCTAHPEDSLLQPLPPSPDSLRLD